MASPPDYRDPPLQCDIVMKGGITSGVVYPGAVMSLGTAVPLQVHRRHVRGRHRRRDRRRGRDAPDRDASFAAVGRLPDELSSAVDGKPFMLQLFQPEPENRRLFGALIRCLERGPLRGALGLCDSFPRAPLLALVLAAAGRRARRRRRPARRVRGRGDRRSRSSLLVAGAGVRPRARGRSRCRAPTSGSAGSGRTRARGGAHAVAARAHPGRRGPRRSSVRCASPTSGASRRCPPARPTRSALSAARRSGR